MIVHLYTALAMCIQMDTGACMHGVQSTGSSISRVTTDFSHFAWPAMR